MVIMDGVKTRDKLLDYYKEIIEEENLHIRLDIIQVGDNKESNIYIKNKLKYTELVGIKSILHELDEDTTTEEVIKLIEKLNEDDEVTGIILQSPTPSNVDFSKSASHISSNKDIDGFTMNNINSLYHNTEGLMPCTVKGIGKLLEEYKINVEGKHAVIVGRGEIVGKPLSLYMLNKNATVTICHSYTPNLSEITKMADILISAVGKKDLITKEMVKDGFVGIDVGISVQEGKMYGDFDFESVKNKASFITPTPGGVGPMTIAMIIDNLIYAKRKEITNG